MSADTAKLIALARITYGPGTLGLKLAAALEAAEAERDALQGDVDKLVGKIGALTEQATHAEVERDEWQRLHEATWVRLPKAVQTIYMREYREARAALAGSDQ